MQRDLVGYGKNVPRIEWPGGARIAISLVVNYEEGAEYSTLDGDSHHETNGEVPSPVPPGDRDLNNESFFEYGSRVGVWRLLDMFQRYQAASTFFCCAMALERNPEVARAIVDEGHEVCGHGYRWEEYHLMDRDSEREAIAKTIDSLERTTGSAFRGLVHPLRTQRQYPGLGGGTRRLHLRQHGAERRPALLRDGAGPTVVGGALQHGNQRRPLLEGRTGQRQRFLRILEGDFRLPI